MVFQGVRDFYHSKFIPAETNFYHFNTGSEELATFTGRLILTPKFRLRFARPDPHAMYMAALSRKGGARASRRAARVGRATRRGCAGACMRRLCASTSDPRILGYSASLFSFYRMHCTHQRKPHFYRFKMCFVSPHFYHFKSKALNFYLTPTLWIRDTVAVSSMPYRTREAINSFPARRTDSDQHFHRTVLSED